MDPSVHSISSDHVLCYNYCGRKWFVLRQEEKVNCKVKRKMDVFFLDVRNKLKENKEVKPTGTSSVCSFFIMKETFCFYEITFF